MYVVATTNIYTENENLREADIVVTCLGEPDGEKGILTQGNESLAFDGVLHVDQLIKYFAN
jgi:hypothetical protein